MPNTEHATFYERRTRRAKVSLKAYAKLTGSDMPEDALVDLIVDMGHFADREKLDYPDLLRRPVAHWLSNQADPYDICAPIVAIYADGQEITSNHDPVFDQYAV